MFPWLWFVSIVVLLVFIKCTLVCHVRSLVDDLFNERRHVSERVGLSYEPLSVIGSVQDLKMLIHLRVVFVE